MSTFTITTLTTLALIASASASNDASCFKLGNKLFGKDLPALCVHHTDDYSVAFDVHDGNVELTLDSNSQANLEIYAGGRVTNDWEDCCPPPSFLTEVACPRIEEQGECCYDATHVHVTGLDSHVGCVHEVVHYGSHQSVGGEVHIPLADPSLNGEVEIYAGLHPNGCCACYMHAVSCSPCAQTP